MSKKALSLLLLSSTAALASLTGCSVGGKGAVKGKFNISISARREASEQTMLKIWKNAYEELHPEVNVIVESWGSITSSEQYVQQYALNRNELTNIIYTTDDTTSLLASKNNFVDLRQYFESDPDVDYTDYYASMLHTTSYNGDFRPTTSYTGPYVDEEGHQKSDEKQYGVYFAPREYNMPALVCNKDAFQKLGIPFPNKASWDFTAFVDLLHTISNTIKDKYEVQKINEYSVYRGIELNQAWEPIYTTLLKHYGSDGLFKFDENEDPVSNVGSAANKHVYSSIVQAFGNGAYKYAIDQDLGNEDFPANTILMAAVSYPEVGNYIASVKNMDFLPFPTEYVGAGCGGYGILVDKVSKTQTVNGVTKTTGELCWDFLKFIISEEGQNLAGREGYIQPVLKKLATTGDWLQSFNPEWDHSAFASAKELKLDTYNFAEAKSRTLLRSAVASLFRSLFQTTATEDSITSYVATAETQIDKALKA